MRLRFWRCPRPAPPTPLPTPPLPRRTPDERPTRATASTGRAPTDAPARSAGITAPTGDHAPPRGATAPSEAAPTDRARSTTAPTEIVPTDAAARPAWAAAPTRVFPVNRPGCPGRLTRAQEWRADGGRWPGGPEGPR
ncbi:hypothetical protein GKC29_11295 [Micromonospora sp. WMMC415]|uniref:hypothetical protein n=1 Tax=Micromonospora sp. WMMC415 TaxID=2675222 RepID=UPI0012B48F61|nr:hypothetical protein [Micromonospora sp. WMMC415]QGN47370.1 hypothetical protein GKC29_11295 [Micromonospora sp. WMMC415]